MRISIFRLNFNLILLLTLLFFSCNKSPEQVKPTLINDESIVLPNGYKAVVIADSLGGRARHIAVNDNGDVYVQMSRLFDGKGIAALRDTNGDARADIIQYFGDHSGTGIEIGNGFLYCSSDNEVFRYTLKPGELLPDESSKVVVAGGFPEQREHASKSFALDDKGNIYVNVGAPSNACQIENRVTGSLGQDPCPQLDRHAGVWRFDANKTNQDQVREGFRYLSGSRNTIALDWNRKTGSLFIVQHGRDQLSQFWPNMYTDVQNADLPSEEFFEVTEGDFLGWPYCYFDHYQDKKILAPEYGGDGKAQGRCADVKRPIVSFPAHIAPNDLLFYNGSMFPETYRDGAFIAFHGSWNRAPLEQKGYFVAFVPFKDGKVSGQWKIFAEGFAGITPVPSPGDAIHRPMGLAVGPDGALYVSDSKKGKIWKVIYEGK